MRLVIVFMVSVLTSVPTSVTQESAQYLESAISNLKDRLNVKQNFRRIDNFPPPKVSQETTQPSGTTVPSLALTKGELTALYEAALNKGQTVTLNNAQGTNLQALVHEIDQTPQPSNSYHADSVLDNDAEGYYYYYYPLKSFMDGFSQGHASSTNLHNDYHHNPHHDYHEQSIKPTAQYLHSHTHQHNVQISSTKSPMEDKKKAMEPLFMAISGFLGMAAMFVLSVFFLPKFGILKPRGKLPENDEMTGIARIALLAIQGDDCSERLACEIGKTANALNLYDNRFVKLMRRMAPVAFKKHLDRVGKYTDSKKKCEVIPCKRKKPQVAKQKKTIIKKA